MNLEFLMQLPVIQVLVQRVVIACLTLPDLQAWTFSGLLLLGYTLIALPVGFKFGFIQGRLANLSWQQMGLVTIAALLSPGISEELVFRVLLLPHPTEAAAPLNLWIWSAIGLFLFILYHPLNAFSFFPAGRKTFVNPVFLSLAALLGIICTLAYLQSGSLWLPVLLHWIVVVVWLLLLDGYGKLYA